MNLIKLTIKANLKYLGLKIDKDKCVWKGDTMIMSNTIEKEKQELCLFYWLEGFSSCYDYEYSR